jgi:hypothetical protein
MSCPRRLEMEEEGMTRRLLVVRVCHRQRWGWGSEGGREGEREGGREGLFMCI